MIEQSCGHVGEGDKCFVVSTVAILQCSPLKDVICATNNVTISPIHLKNLQVYCKY